MSCAGGVPVATESLGAVTAWSAFVGSSEAAVRVCADLLQPQRPCSLHTQRGCTLTNSPCMRRLAGKMLACLFACLLRRQKTNSLCLATYF